MPPDATPATPATRPVALPLLVFPTALERLSARTLRERHELRTPPLHAILGFAQLLGVVDEVLDISRIEAGRLELDLARRERRRVPARIERPQAAGVAAYLTEPIDVHELLGLVDRLLPG